MGCRVGAIDLLNVTMLLTLVRRTRVVKHFCFRSVVSPFVLKKSISISQCLLEVSRNETVVLPSIESDVVE